PKPLQLRVRVMISPPQLSMSPGGDSVDDAIAYAKVLVLFLQTHSLGRTQRPVWQTVLASTVCLFCVLVTTMFSNFPLRQLRADDGFISSYTSQQVRLGIAAWTRRFHSLNSLSSPRIVQSCKRVNKAVPNLLSSRIPVTPLCLLRRASH